MTPPTVEMDWLPAMQSDIARLLRQLQDVKADPNSGVWSGQIEGVYAHLVKAQHQLLLLDRGWL